MSPDLVRTVAALVHPEALKIVLVLFLSFLLGLEREGRKATAGHYIFGGVRTFPLIGLLGYAIALISGTQFLPVALGFVVVGAFLLVSYLHKLASAEEAGVTTEISGLVTYVLGVLVYDGYYWIAITVVVLSMLLLELKVALEGLSERIPPEEVITFTKFLLLTVVILPAVPDQEFTRFHLNPFRTWLIVAAVSAISYGSYVLQRVTKKRGGVVFAALLGGLYSSTLMTVALARRGRRENRPNLFAGSMVVASGMMYLRVLVLLAIFNGSLLARLMGPFLALGVATLLAGFAWSRLPDRSSEAVKREYEAKNPLEIGSAFLFAAIFLVALIATGLVLEHFGTVGIYALATLMGVTDVDPFIMGLTQTAGASMPLDTAAAAIVVATAANNAIKGIYARIFSDRDTGTRGLLALLALALVGLLPLLAVLR
ncbi:MAG TPA: MgtC/SapB family protein [Thermoanaerobaculaceae bacterium]|nr:MgtC/SapB family protein [Thermoanaerobaculaceae bacterium]